MLQIKGCYNLKRQLINDDSNIIFIVYKRFDPEHKMLSKKSVRKIEQLVSFTKHNSFEIYILNWRYPSVLIRMVKYFIQKYFIFILIIYVF